MTAYNQLSQSAVYREDDISVSLTVCGGSYGGGSEVLVLQRRFSDVNWRDTEISPTIEAGGGEGGNNLPMILAFDNRPNYISQDVVQSLTADGGAEEHN